MERFYRSRETVGLLVGLVSLVIVFSPLYIFIPAVAFLSYRVAKEVSQALKVELYPVFASTVFLISCLHTGMGIVLSAILSLTRGYRSWSMEDFLKSFLVLIYAGILPSYLYTLKVLHDYQLLKVLIFTWVVDVFSYYVGKHLGKHPFFPKLSPKKTWEGFLGGAIGGVVTFSFISGLPPFKSLLCGVLLILCAVSGDLFKSFIKRQVGIKDFSDILGGHGGFTDRFDSLLFTAPVYSALIVL
ncbi:phosphatidate cytidylyltransferase [Hydrogenobacter thermophilus]|uniref:phosphatidate cytidylyltransferase n=1 Tax=Hydrogenobacter thermophilus TaxID=940 RepID=UPI0030FC344F